MIRRYTFIVITVSMLLAQLYTSTTSLAAPPQTASTEHRKA